MGYVWCEICVGYVWCEICVGYVWREIRQQSSEEPCDETSFGKKAVKVAFAALKKDGSVVTWGCHYLDLDLKSGPSQCLGLETYPTMFGYV